ncbi:MAG: hypothetical protein Q7S45_00065 [Candidatus Curtissbacteria bacterium]|nr:hypothetical protein [Candidatus Curtissbacteria bacterium]
MRDERWLEKQLEFLLGRYFADVKITNPIEIKFGREAKFRFGSIKLLKPKGLHFLTRRSKPQKSIITITAMFAKEDVPADVVCFTICHELTHYAHGFSSTNKRLFRHPHHGGVVDAEIKKRGGGHLIRAYKLWIKGYRKRILEGRAKI